MRKLSITIVFLCCIGITQAQRWIPKIGITLPTITYNQDVYRSGKIGFVAGLGYEIPIGKSFFFQPEVLIAQRGTNFEYATSPFISLTTYYFEIPATLKYRWETKKVSVSALSGFALGIGIDGRQRSLDGSNTFHRIRYKSYTYSSWHGDDNFAFVDNRFDLAWQSGVSIEFMQDFIFEVRMGWGLTKLYKNKNRDTIYDEALATARNNVLQFNIGIPLEKRKDAQ